MQLSASQGTELNLVHFTAQPNGERDHESRIDTAHIPYREVLLIPPSIISPLSNPVIPGQGHGKVEQGGPVLSEKGQGGCRFLVEPSAMTPDSTN